MMTVEIRLREDGEATAGPRTFDPSLDGWRMMAFHAATDADVHASVWEVHPEAEEVVACLTGGLRCYFRPSRPAGQESFITVTAGSAVIVPRGQWHRIELDAPSDILAVTLPRGTRHENRAEA
jgi:mannose-6-phosphate isomerase-like protein (cupin superfamily)